MNMNNGSCHLALTLCLGLTLALAGACSKDDAAPPATGETAGEGAAQAGGESAAKPEGSAHAAAGAVPGSHEDWCGEHGVHESQCTRCNPELTAAFKATGDWCAEHGLPESQCTRCNPELTIVRPPPADGAGNE